MLNVSSLQHCGMPVVLVHDIVVECSQSVEGSLVDVELTGQVSWSCSVQVFWSGSVPGSWSGTVLGSWVCSGPLTHASLMLCTQFPGCSTLAFGLLVMNNGVANHPCVHPYVYPIPVQKLFVMFPS